MDELNSPRKIDEIQFKASRGFKIEYSKLHVVIAAVNITNLWQKKSNIYLLRKKLMSPHIKYIL